MRPIQLKFIILILFFIAVLCGFIVYKIYIYAPKPFYKPTLTNQKNLQMYIWKKYEYAFLYDGGFVLRGEAPEPIPPGDDAFYFHPNGKNEPLLQSTISIDRLGERKNQNLEEFIRQYYEQWLSYNHLSGKFEPPHSGKVIKINNYPFTTPYGINGYESYFTIEDWEDDHPNKKSYSEAGPFFTFELIDANKSYQDFRIIGGDHFEGRQAVTTFLNTLKHV